MDSVFNIATKKQMKKHPRNPSVGGEERIQMDRLWKKDLGSNTDIEMEQCSVCKGKFKRLGLKIHQTKAGCAKQLSDSHRTNNKSEATSSRDTNHSDASGQVSLKTTRRGNGAKVTGAMGNLFKVYKEKMAGETCNEGEMVTKGKLSRLENTKVREKTDIRNWIKKKEQLKKESIQQVKSELDKASGAEIIDLTEEIASSKSEEKEMAVHEKGKVGAAIIDLKKVADIIRQGKIKVKVDIQSSLGAE